MLVLTRKEDQAIHIGSDVVVKVLSISGGRIRLGIDAPRDLSVLRGELRAAAPAATVDLTFDASIEAQPESDGDAIPVDVAPFGV